MTLLMLPQEFVQLGYPNNRYTDSPLLMNRCKKYITYVFSHHAREAAIVPLSDVVEAKQRELFALLVDGLEAEFDSTAWIPKDASDD